VTLTFTIQTRPRLCRVVVPRVCSICGDDVWLLRVSFNSTLESLPLQLCPQPLTGNNFAIDRLGNLPGRSCALDLIPCFFYKKAPTPISPPRFKLLPSSLDLDLAIWFLLQIQQSESLASFFSRSRSSYMVPSSNTIKWVTCFLLL
jgi:hypothetical protein